jgi:hypothetical protein
MSMIHFKGCRPFPVGPSFFWCLPSSNYGYMISLYGVWVNEAPCQWVMMLTWKYYESPGLTEVKTVDMVV